MVNSIPLGITHASHLTQMLSALQVSPWSQAFLKCLGTNETEACSTWGGPGRLQRENAWEWEWAGVVRQGDTEEEMFQTENINSRLTEAQRCKKVWHAPRELARAGAGRLECG